MKILFLNWNGYGNEDVIDTLKEMMGKGEDIELLLFGFDIHKDGDSKEFYDDFASYLSEKNPDFVLSMNYYPIISKACQKVGVKYAAWVYDNPVVSLFSYTLINSCNYVFLFDSQMYEMFSGQGIKTVYYLPLAAPVSRYRNITVTQEEKRQWGGEISFVGSLYNEKGNFYDRIKDKLTDHTRGYLEGIMRAQMQVWGLNMVEGLMNEQCLDEMVNALGLEPNYDGVETLEYLYSNYVMYRKITAIEREELLKTIGERHEVKLYTKNKAFSSKGINNLGQIDYYSEMPLVFKSSDINLNITLRSIQRGIPLRCMDIMGCGGFLLTNYQEDLMRFFVPGEEFVYFESREDLLRKIDYYLEHEEERKKISEKAYEKMSSEHNYERRLRYIISVVMKNSQFF